MSPQLPKVTSTHDDPDAQGTPEEIDVTEIIERLEALESAHSLTHDRLGEIETRISEIVERFNESDADDGVSDRGDE